MTYDPQVDNDLFKGISVPIPTIKLAANGPNFYHFGNQRSVVKFF